ncbi:hypothetical protein [Muriicola sp. Z0-33]|uniref:hypothetical protein n=1 Tax=Muriicola sp. Z0-33 TaxID=2816957 RepID=UPI002236F611|nr:hypothetical protein [Muriicola sp. Z0-33]MCW5517847.1 hypothetical protein [Muriicola sp. Z0-33]
MHLRKDKDRENTQLEVVDMKAEAHGFKAPSLRGFTKTKQSRVSACIVPGIALSGLWQDLQLQTKLQHYTSYP